MDKLRAEATALTALDIDDCDEAEAFHEVVGQIHRLSREVRRLEKSGLDRKEIIESLHDARRVHACSPFIRRLQEWPRGYPGDFETVEYLLDQVNKAPTGTIGYYLEQYALACTAAQQHRNKVIFQGELIRRVVHGLDDHGRNAHPYVPRILSIACGSCADLRRERENLQQGKARYVLSDADPEALEFSARRLGDLNGQCSFVDGNVFKRLSTLRRYGPFDLVVVGGLSDYLNDRQLVALVSNVANRLLAESGKFYFTNITPDNLYRPWIEHLADWCLIHRNESDIVRVVTEAGVDPDCLRIQRDGSGLTMLVEVANC